LTSEVSRRAAAFVDMRLPEARALGATLADLTEDPETFTRTLTDGLHGLADATYAQEQERVAPGAGATIGVRWPLVHAIERALNAPLRESSSSSTLWLAQRLARSEFREVRLFSLPALLHTLPEDPERAWQLMRRLARGAQDWISVDSLAHVYAAGILAEPFRWAEIEQLVYSQHRMERRLVGSTLATVPHELTPAARRAGAAASIAPRAMAIVAQLMGDADDQVQKALSWAIREWSRVAQGAAEQLLRAETRTAVARQDGNRAWVIRDALTLIDQGLAADLRNQLAGIRRRPGATSSSPAAEASATFLAVALSADQTLTDRAVAMQGERFGRRSA
jgi:3-methyladenine DNA glycosylase AlkD